MRCRKRRVKKIVGQGAVWPAEPVAQDIANEILLEIEAGSMGRPNQAQEIANAQRLMPLLIQLPGIDPEFLAKDTLRRLDDRLDLTEAFKSALPSIVAMNGAMSGARRARPRRAPAPAPGAAMGPQGAVNAPDGGAKAAPPPSRAGRADNTGRRAAWSAASDAAAGRRCRPCRVMTKNLN